MSGVMSVELAALILQPQYQSRIFPIVNFQSTFSFIQKKVGFFFWHTFYGLRSLGSYRNSAVNKTGKIAAIVEFNLMYIYEKVWMPNK